MPQKTVTIAMPLGSHWLRWPKGVDRRLQALLDRQDQGIPLTAAERREAEGLVDLSLLVSLLRSRVEIAKREANTNGQAVSPGQGKAPKKRARAKASKRPA